jgi:FkbM family methyltransferase
VPIFRRANLVVLKKNRFDELHNKIDQYSSYIKWSERLQDSDFREFMKNSIAEDKSNAQLEQDLVALYISKLHKNSTKFFVEFGATDGKTYSNTFLLEERFLWKGILAEPAKIWEKELRKNRICAIDLRCVWSKSGESLNFSEVKDASYSTLSEFSALDHHEKLRRKNRTYQVSTVSLEELLHFHGAPKNISYLSIDTEGSELEILRSFNFSYFNFDFISVEHNFSENREAIHSLLIDEGYIRILTSFSEWDDWYIRACEEVENFIGTLNEEN